MNKAVRAPIVICLTVAGFAALAMFDPRDNGYETAAKGVAVLAALLLALSLARDARNAEKTGADQVD